jgi:hypothetical protein
VQATDTSAIQRVIGSARVRMRTQWALEGAATATVLAAAVALVAIFLMRLEIVDPLIGLGVAIAAAALVPLGALASALRRIDDESVARRIDRASNLADRLSTAIAFQREITLPSASAHAETYELMVAAIRDGVRVVPRANVKAATPFTMPRDAKAALAFVAVSALAAGLALPTTDRAPHIYSATPSHGIPGTEVILRGDNLMTGVAVPLAGLPKATKALGAPDITAEAKPGTLRGFVPADAAVFMGPMDAGRPILVLDWSRDAIRVKIPNDAPIGDTHLSVRMPDKSVLGPIAFTVLDPKDENNFKKDAVVFDKDERAYIEAIIAELHRIAKRDHLDDLEAFAKQIEQLLKDAEEGKITKEQLLEALAKAEEALNAGLEPNQEEIKKKLGELGKELQKSDITKELGAALEKNELDKAKEELQELARKLEKSQLEKKLEELQKQLEDKNLTEQQKKDIQKKIDELKKQLEQDQKELEKQLENKDLSEAEKKELQKKLEELKKEKPLTEQQKQDLQKQLEKAAEQMAKQEKSDQQKQEQQKQKLEQEIKRLQKQKDEAKNDKERLDAERQLNKKKDELQKLDKQNDDKEQSAQRQALKRLQRDMEKAAEDLQKPNKQESQDEKDERERQASQKLKDAARETGKVDQDQRKQATQKKLSSQMDDLREAMRRAKQKGNKSPQDPFGRNAKNEDFGKRARGQKGSGQSWKPGQGQGQGQGQQGQPGGPGGGNGGKEWGTGTGPDLTGDETAKSGNTKDADLEGKQGKEGSTRRQTILAAAQKGFASARYRDVYTDYQRIVEEVMRTEKLPSSYKYYVKRYFAKIHPSGAAETIEKKDIK